MNMLHHPRDHVGTINKGDETTSESTRMVIVANRGGACFTSTGAADVKMLERRD